MGYLFLLFLQQKESKMTRLFFLISFSLIVFSCNRKSQSYISSWKSNPPVLDGMLDDWQLPLEQPSAQFAIKYRCSNDNEYLYLAIQAGDDMTKSLLLQQGAKIWIDTTGKRKEKFGISYPIPIKTQEIEALFSEAKGDEKLFLRLYAESLQEFDVIGWADEPLRLSNLTSKDTKVSMGFDELKTLSIEIRIPLKLIYKRVPNFNETFSLGVEINKPKNSTDASSEDGLFNDQNQTGITQSNPLLGPNPNQRQYTGPSKDLSMPNIWTKVKLSSELRKVE